MSPTGGRGQSTMSLNQRSRFSTNPMGSSVGQTWTPWRLARFVSRRSSVTRTTPSASAVVAMSASSGWFAAVGSNRLNFLRFSESGQSRLGRIKDDAIGRFDDEWDGEDRVGFSSSGFLASSSCWTCVMSSSIAPRRHASMMRACRSGETRVGSRRLRPQRSASPLQPLAGSDCRRGCT